MHRPVLALVVAVCAAAPAHADCVGDYPYRVCSDVYTAPNGDTTVRSYDSEGNTYSVSSSSRELPGGGSVVESHDSEGNSYSVESWSDSSGVHSRDSEGNTCTITNTGTVIGCGE